MTEPVRLDDPLPGPARAEQSRFPCFDGLRALAATAVVVCHTVQLSPTLASTAGAYLIQLRAGVQVFFVISGFLLYRPFARAHLTRDPGPAAAGYFRRRLLRIYPGYWVALTVSVFVLGVADLDSLRSAFFNYALLQSYDGAQSLFGQGLSVAWTLVIEVTFYCTLPVFAFVVGRLGARRPVVTELLGVTALIVAGVACSAWTAYGDPPTFVFVLPANLAPFGLGMLLAVVSAWTDVRRAVPGWLTAIGRVPWAWWMVAVFAWSATVWWVGIEAIYEFGDVVSPSQIFATQLLFTVFGFAIVVPAAIGDQERGPIRRALQARPIVFVGLCSYGVYLWHTSVATELTDRLDTGSRGANFFAITVLTFAVSLGVAAASWYLVERPAVTLSRRGLGRGGRTRARAQP